MPQAAARRFPNFNSTVNKVMIADSLLKAPNSSSAAVPQAMPFVVADNDGKGDSSGLLDREGGRRSRRSNSTLLPSIEETNSAVIKRSAPSYRRPKKDYARQRDSGIVDSSNGVVESSASGGGGLGFGLTLWLNKFMFKAKQTKTRLTNNDSVKNGSVAALARGTSKTLSQVPTPTETPVPRPVKKRPPQKLEPLERKSEVRVKPPPKDIEKAVLGKAADEDKEDAAAFANPDPKTGHQNENPSNEGNMKAAATASQLRKIYGQAEALKVASWNSLRSRLNNARMRDALSAAKVMVAGEEYTTLRLLGKGGYSSVYEVYNSKKEIFALKVVDFENTKSTSVQESLFKEIQFLNQIGDSKHVVRLFDFEHNTAGENTLYMLLEKGETDLADVIRCHELDSNLTPAKIRFYWEQMLEGVQFIHRRRIVHADLKPDNFIVVRGQAKLIDFGFAGAVLPGHDVVYRSYLGGTKEYFSPESLHAYYEINADGCVGKTANTNFPVGFKSDVWALGVILYQLVYKGDAPFMSVIGGKVGRLKAMLDLDLPVNYEPLDDPTLLEALKLCLEKRPEKRATVSRMLRQAFLRPGAGSPKRRFK